MREIVLLIMIVTLAVFIKILKGKSDDKEALILEEELKTLVAVSEKQGYILKFYLV